MDEGTEFFHCTSLQDFVSSLLFVIANEPEHDTESQGRPCQGRDYTRRGLIEIENDKSAHQSEQRDQHHGPNLNSKRGVLAGCTG